MSIKVTCPKCSAMATAADNAAGKSAKCRKCGSVIQIPRSVAVPVGAAAAAEPLILTVLAPPPMLAASAKVCVGCGMDVSHEKRVKDEQGNYYCHPCFVRRSLPQQEPGVTPAPLVEDEVPANAPMDDAVEASPAEIEVAETYLNGAVGGASNVTSDDPANAAEGGADFEPAPEAVALPPIAYASPRRTGVMVPDYGGLKSAAVVFNVIALLNVAGAVLVLVGGVAITFMGIGGDRSSTAAAGVMGFVVFLGPALGLLVTAFLFRALAHAITAFRDIARNSWISAFGRD